MLSATIQQLIDLWELPQGIDKPIARNHYIICSSKDVVVYIGKAQCPTSRVLQHLGVVDEHFNPVPKELWIPSVQTMDAVWSKVAKHVWGNYPRSLEWVVKFPTHEEVKPYLFRVFPHIKENFGNYDVTERREVLQDEGEKALIRIFNPQLNVNHNFTPTAMEDMAYIESPETTQRLRDAINRLNY